MNKFVLFFLSMALLLPACGGRQPSWQEEPIVESSRLLSDDVKVEWALAEGQNPDAEGTLIQLRAMKKNGEAIEEFDISHEKLLHLIVVSKDLSYFTHIHPEYKGGGLFEIVNDFPAGGEYRFIADFKPSDGGSMTKLAWIEVEGEPAPFVPAGMEPTAKDAADGKEVSMSVEGLGANQDAVLTFTISDEETGEPITDLDPYLGAIGHVVVLSEDGERYLHVHAEENQGTGPTAKFETSFPRSGAYKLWAQFQQDGQVFTVSYVIDVP